MNDKILVFVHIPKTAGASLTQIIRNNYPSHQIFSTSNPTLNTVSEINQNTKCIIGHNVFGQHQELGPQMHMTMLRDPIDRVISHYYYNKYVLKKNNIGSLEHFAQTDANANLQTRYITGHEPNVDEAIEHLKTFAFFGITEMFLPSLFLMKKTFGWKNIEYPKANVNAKRPKNESISKETIEQIKKENLLDIKLYQWAKTQLEQRLKSLDQKEKLELKSWIP